MHEKNFLTLLPVYNEADTVHEVLNQVVTHADHVLVVDDGSTDGTGEQLGTRDDVAVLTHEENRGYGAALISGFEYAIRHGYGIVVTIDCDGQHEPQRIRQFVTTCRNTGADIVSGSRYLKCFGQDTPAPAQRRQINKEITGFINDRLGFGITDAFCGFKAYRVEALRRLRLTETGYAMPLELWVQAACQNLSVIEVAVPLIYLDENRSFGGELDDGAARLSYYYGVLEKSFEALPGDCDKLRQGERVG